MENNVENPEEGLLVEPEDTSGPLVETPEASRTRNGQMAASKGLVNILDEKEATEDVSPILASEDPVATFVEGEGGSITKKAIDGLDGTGDVLEAVSKTDAYKASVNNRFLNYKEVLRNKEKTSHLSEQQVADISLGLTIQEIFGELYEEEGILGTTSTIGGLFIPLRTGTLMDNIEEEMSAEGYLGDDTNWLFNQYQAGTIMQRLNDVYSGLEPEQKLEFATSLASIIKDDDLGTDNPLIGKDVFQAITGLRDVNETVENIFSGLDVPVFGPIKAAVSAGTAGAATIKTLTKLKRRSALDDIAKATDDPELALTAAEVAKNPETAKLLNTDPDRVEDMFDVFSQQSYKELVDDAGLDSNMAGTLDKYRREMLERVKWHMEATKEEGILTPTRELEVMQFAETRVAQEVPGDLTNFKVVSKDESGFKFEFTVDEIDSSGAKTSKTYKDEYTYTWNDLGELVIDPDSYKQLNQLNPMTYDANTRFSGDMKALLVQGQEENLREVSKVSEMFDQLQAGALKSLGAKGRNRVFYALQEGGEQGKVFTPAELMLRNKWERKDVEAYYKMRNVFDWQKMLKDKEIIKLYNAQGVKFFDDGGEVGAQAVKTFSSPEEALKAFKKDDLKSVAVQGDKTSLNDLTEEVVKKWTDEGYSLVRTQDEIGGIKLQGKRVGWAFVKDLEKPSPGRVTGKVKGYFPRASENGYYFLKRKENIAIDGFSGTRQVLRTIAQSDGKQGLLEELRKLKEHEANLVGPRVGREPEYTIVADRDLPAGDMIRDVTLSSGGMFTGKRASTPVPFIQTFNKRKKFNPTTMLTRMNAHTGSVVGRQVRNARMEQQLVKAVNEKFGTSAKGVHDLRRVADTLPSRAKLMVNDALDQVEAAKGMPSPYQKVLDDRFWAWGEKLENGFKGEVFGIKMIPNPAPLVYALASGRIRPLDAMRTAAFTCYLGGANVSQLVVQGSGLTVALLANPVHFTKAMPQMVGGAIVDIFAARSMKGQKLILNQMRSMGLGEYVDGYEVWRKSGMFTSVSRMQDDAVSMFANSPSSAFTKANTFFYTQGELINARSSFFTALQKYRSQNKGFDVKNPTKEDIRNISDIAENYRLNMSRGNASVLQTTPGLNVMFQFWQVLHKFTSKVMPKQLGGTDEFTLAEKSRLTLGTLGLMGGYQSVPFGEQIINNVLGKDVSELSHEEAVGLRYGALGYLLKFGLGVESNITHRVSLGFDINRQIREQLLDKELMAAIMGPTAGIASRGYNALQTTATAFDLVLSQEEDMTLEDVRFLIATGLDSTASMFTSYRNARTYWANVFSQSQKLTKKNGEYILHSAGLNEQTAMAALLGLAPMELNDMYEAKFLYKDKKVRELDVDQSIDIMIQLTSNAIQIDDFAESNYLAKLSNMVLMSFDEEERYDIMHKALAKIREPQNSAQEIIDKMFIEEIEKIEEGERKMSVYAAQHRQPEELTDDKLQ